MVISLFNHLAQQFFGQSNEQYLEAASLRNLAQGGTIIRNTWITSYDPDAPDALNSAISDIVETVSNRLIENGSVKTLQENASDGRYRQAWQQNLFSEIREELNKIPALSSDNYRHALSPGHEDDPRFSKDVTRHNSLNALSDDMKNGTFNVEWDCERQSAVMGMIATMVEDKTLGRAPEGTEPGSQHSHDYYYLSGKVFFGSEDFSKEKSSRHAFIGADNGDLIEATASGRFLEQNYLYALSSSYTIDDFIDGKPFVSYDGDVYSTEGLSSEKATASLERTLDEGLTRAAETAKMGAEYMQRASENPEIGNQLADITHITEQLQVEGDHLSIGTAAYDASGLAQMNANIMETIRNTPDLNRQIGTTTFNPIGMMIEANSLTQTITRLALDHNIELDPGKLENIKTSMQQASQTGLAKMPLDAFPSFGDQTALFMIDMELNKTIERIDNQDDNLTRRTEAAAKLAEEAEANDKADSQPNYTLAP